MGAIIGCCPNCNEDVVLHEHRGFIQKMHECGNRIEYVGEPVDNVVRVFCDACGADWIYGGDEERDLNVPDEEEFEGFRAGR